MSDSEWGKGRDSERGGRVRSTRRKLVDPSVVTGSWGDGWSPTGGWGGEAFERDGEQ